MTTHAQPPDRSHAHAERRTSHRRHDAGAAPPALPGYRWVRPMAARDPHEHRAATPLELLFDLCFVVAIAQLSAHLHHGYTEGAILASLPAYGMVFFAIWWAWINFTWLASAYDNDDTAYRLKVLIQIAGVLVLAAGVPRAFEHRDFSVVTLGYAIMRVGLVAQWLRAGRDDPAGRGTALRYAIGVTLCQIGWLGLLAVPKAWWLYGFVVLLPCELLVPAWAEGHRPTSWNRHHIAERFGLMTLIVLGESVLAATLAIQAAIDATAFTWVVARVAAGGLLIVFSMWWIYFGKPVHLLLVSNKVAFPWGYAHYLVFAAAAAVGAGLAAFTDTVTGHAHVSVRAAAMTIAVPVAVFLAVVWAIHVRPFLPRLGPAVVHAVAIVLVLAAPWSPWPVLSIGLVLAALIALLLAMHTKAKEPVPDGILRAT